MCNQTVICIKITCYYSRERKITVFRLQSERFIPVFPLRTIATRQRVSYKLDVTGPDFRLLLPEAAK
jgi:hypothetical protein